MVLLLIFFYVVAQTITHSILSSPSPLRFSPMQALYEDPELIIYFHSAHPRSLFDSV